MKAIFQTRQFKKDFKRIKKRGKDLNKLKEDVSAIANNEVLEERDRDHALSGNWSGSRNCHIEPDWILIDRGRWRPKIGEEVRFILGIDPKGRDCAKRVTFVKSSGDNEIVRSRVGVGSWVLLVLLLVLPLRALLWIPMPWWLCVGGMLVASAITYRMYGHDKQQAIAGGWRVPESWLHFAELAGGWPGAFVAQRRLRHKCSKPSYQSIFWTLILLYQIAAANVILDQRLSRALIEILNR